MTEHTIRTLAGKWLGIAFLLLAAAIGGLWYATVAAYEAAVLRERGRELQAVADLKIEFVRAWLEERRGDAAVLAGLTLPAEALASRGAAASKALAHLFDVFRAEYGYEAILLYDAAGRLRAKAGAPRAAPPEATWAAARQAIEGGQIRVSRAYHAGSGEQRHLDIDFAVPVVLGSGGSARIAGALVLHIDPRRQLDAMLGLWPAPSESGETFLVERMEGKIAYLSALRHADAAAVQKKVNDPALPAALAARGMQGVTEGLDYRGVPVVAAVGQVPGMPWFVVAKLDRAEILAPVRREARWSGALSALLLLALGVIMFLWRRRSLGELAMAQQSAAKDALAAGEARFRKLHEHGWDFNALFDRDMVVRYASPSIDHYLGRQAVGETIAVGTARVHPDDVARVEAARQAALQQPGQPQCVEHRFARGDGGWISLESCFTSHFDDPDIDALAYTARDVSGRVEAERRQRESEERYRFLFENNPLPMWVYDKETLAFLDVNRAAVAQYGYTRDEFLAMTLRDIRPPEDVPALEEEVKSDRRREGRIWTHRRKDGSLLKAAIWSQDSHFSGRPERMILAVDETTRVAAEEALRESEERYRSLFELSPDAVFVHQNDIVLFANDVAARLFHAESAHTLIGRNWHTLVAQDDWPITEERIAALNCGAAIRLPPLERRYLTMDGQIIAVESAAARILIDGEPAVLAVIRDITERRQAEAQRLAEARRQRDTLVREVHHRIKNHLQGLAGLLNQHKRKHPALREPLDAVIAQVTAISLIHGLQSRGVDGEVRLYGLLREIVKFQGGLAALEFANAGNTFCENCAWRIADEESVPLALVLNELVTNAIKHRDAPSAPVRIACACTDAHIVVTLGNSGSLPPGFDFNAGAGLGTGLTLLRSLLPRSGAALSFSCSGGRVETRLALSAPAVSRQAADQRPARPPEGR